MKHNFPATLGLLLLVSPSCRLQSPEEDVRLGSEVAAAMEGQVGRFDDPELVT